MRAKITLNLLVFVLGLGLTSAGAALVYPPLGLLVPGVVLMFISLYGGRTQ